ncbi:unnamed protein product [Clonostachys solani]|uniref:Uncharacterized protein n=1 Tax=Clonostachys solani TaxID=160281 RepID=A0A9N9ZE10_9HYPO|nr:unnamed protein product [Clonostachys solani]
MRPSSLVKYLHVGSDGSGHKYAWSESAESWPGTASASSPSMSEAQGRRAAQRLNKEGLLSHSYHHSVPTPGQKLTTDGDRVAARLVIHLQSAPNRGMVLQTKYLKHLPKCMETCPALRDSIDLFCSVWHRYRRGERTDNLAHLPEYARAIRSLRCTLALGDEGITVETLASITILGRTEALFNYKNNGSSIHELGIASLNERLGPPKAGDELHSSLVAENYIVLVPYWIRRKDCDFFMNKGSWNTPSANATADLFQNQALRPHTKAAFKASQTLCSKLASFYRDCHIIHSSADRDNPSVMCLARKLMADLRQGFDTSTDVNDKLFKKAKELGVVTEIDDPSSITGKSYQIADVSLFQMNMCWMASQMLVLKMLFDCSVVYPEYGDSAALWVLLRKLCVHVWKFIPALLDLESFVAVTSLDVIYPTIEAATREEKEYLLDVLASLDRYRQTLPTDRILLEKAIMSYSALFSGRLSPHAPLDFETCKWWKQKKAYKDTEAPPTLTHFMSPPPGAI